MKNRYGVSFGGGFVYGPQPGMTSGDTIARYTGRPQSQNGVWPGCDPLPDRALTGAYPPPKAKSRKT